MNFLPISLNIKDKKILIIGGGNLACQKIQNLLLFTNKITVLAPEIVPEIVNTDAINKIYNCYHPKYLKGFFLIYACTNVKSVNEQILQDSENAGLLCNCTGNTHHSSFISPGIINNDSMIIALNSKNQEVRKMMALKNEIETWLNEKEQQLINKKHYLGKVFLVGFGPGNPGLLTIRGEKLLQLADVIFYDDLLDSDALSKYRGDKIYVGKRRDNHSKEQSEINEILYQSAKSGKMVVRLKGGDPLIFGRGSEEKYYLEKRGIEVEIIPGITSAIAAAAVSGIPLTHRGISSSVAFGTAHKNNSFKILDSDTSVYYMGAANIKEIAQKYLNKNYPPDYPVGLICNVSMPGQTIIKTTLSELVKGNILVKSPVISIFGNTVNYEYILKEAQEISYSN